MKILKLSIFILLYMIITKQKDFSCLLELLQNKSVFIVGCSQCATLCNTGGEKEVLEMKQKLQGKNIAVTGWVILDPACHFTNDKRLLRKYKNEIEKAKKILVLACGNGVQTVSDIFDNIDVISGTDTLFLGEIKRVGDFEKKCDLCGECVVDVFSGLCPVACCPKSMLNGPCGGVNNGKCEISDDIDCVWHLIIEHLKNNKKLDKLHSIQEPKDWSKSTFFKRRI